MRTLAAAALLVALTPARADVYMHNPRGSNDRNCERNVNRNNGNRLFDSQNNAKGGYACPRAVGGPTVDNNDQRDGTGSSASKMEYYAGSILPIEWTAQHGCGAANDKLHCELVIQYACETDFDAEGKFSSPPGNYGRNSYIGTPRDGIPRDQQDAATETIPLDEESAHADTIEHRRFGMHETYDYYTKCKTTERNKGLFTADQRVRRNDATGTRQNPNGNRNGLECPEERDHYPYWRPTPWRDVAVLVSNPSRCDYYREQTENALGRHECELPADDPANADAGGRRLSTYDRWLSWLPQAAGLSTQKRQLGWRKNNLIPNNREACDARGGTFVQRAAKGEDAASPFQCLAADFSRVNHLGNADQGFVGSPVVRPDGAPLDWKNEGSAIVGQAYEDGAVGHATANRYLWRVPNTPSSACVLRMRYNISTYDYDPWDPAGDNGTPGINATLNGKEKSPITQDPYVKIGALPTDFISLALNTNQYGRTFQDRSYAFAIKSRTAAMGSTPIYNLNVRGKRGNIVQTYPAVEYDFVPNVLQLNRNDMVHFQWTGSDYNPRRGCNNGEGGPPDPPDSVEAAKQNSRADRSNIMEVNLVGENINMDTYDEATGATAGQLLQGKTMFVTSQNGPVDTNTVAKLAFLDQNVCLTEGELNEIKNKNQRENHPQNCAKLNAKVSPYTDMLGGPIRMKQPGKFHYFSSRNNNFSNRDQTGTICIRTGPGDSSAANDCGSVVNAPKAQRARLTQLESDQLQAVTEDQLLIDDLLAPAFEKDNDALGDGDQEGCERLFIDFLRGIGPGGIVALSVGLVAVGALAAVVGMWAVRRWQGDESTQFLAGGETSARAQELRESKAWLRGPEPRKNGAGT